MKPITFTSLNIVYELLKFPEIQKIIKNSEIHNVIINLSEDENNDNDLKLNCLELLNIIEKG
jgi:hypothetical protein